GPTGAAEGADPAAPLRAVAELLEGAGETVVLWGERVSHGGRGREAVEALLAVAEALELRGRDGSGLIEVPEGTNGRGLREVGCVPGLGPGRADGSPGREAAAMADALAAGELGALLLVHADPLREQSGRERWESALGDAGALVAISDFRTDELERHAAVVFPAESWAEKEGTVTHPDGRLQRARQAVGHLGEVRPGWWVLTELAARVGAPLAAAGPPLVTDALAAAVPFYAGLTLDELGGHGVRWQEREAAAAAPAAEPSTEPLAEPPAPPDGLRLGAVRSLWTGPDTEHSPALRFLAPRQRAELSPVDARRLGVATGDEIIVSANGASVRAEVALRSGVNPGSVFLIAGTADHSATALEPGPVEVSKVAAAIA
ncbi:MAG: molybdopterin oxidoreductase family protein, partial [Nocardioidaceae bacterium]